MWVASALLLCVFGGSLAQAQEVVLARAFQGPTFARIVFDWPAPVQYAASAGGNLLLIEFDRALTADLTPITQTLGDVVLEAQVGDDGQSVTLLMSAAFQVKTIANGRSVIFDIVTPGRGVAQQSQPRAPPAAQASRPAPAAAPPRQPAPTVSSTSPGSTPTGNAPAVRVRAGIHDTYTRVVFDWPGDVGYTVNKSGGSITVEFDHPATFGISRRLAGGSLSRIGSMSGGPGGRGSSASLSVDPESRVRHFRNGRSVVVDVLGGETQVAARAPQRATAPAREPSPPPAAPVAPVQTSRTPPPTADDSGAVDGAAAGQPGGLRLSFAQSDGALSATFAWDAPVAASFFERAGYVWAVFDANGEVAIEPISESLGDTVLQADAVPVEGATAVRLRLAPEFLAAGATRVGGAWRLDFRNVPGAPAVAVDPRRELGPEGVARVALPLPEAADSVILADPEVGDVLRVVPSMRAGAGVAAERAFAQFRVLASAQGVAVEPWSDLVSVETDRRGVIVGTPGGLALSPDGLEQAPVVALSEEQGGGEGDGEGASHDEGGTLAADDSGDALHDDESDVTDSESLLRYADWSLGDDREYYANLGQLNVALSMAPEDRRAEAEWDLARFYFAHGLAPETLSVLRLLAARDPSIEQDRAYRALRGASQLRLARVTEAAEDLLDPTFSADPGVSLWRGAVYAAREDWALAAQEFAIGSFALEQVFPLRQRREFQLMSARAAIEVEDIETVQSDLAGFDSLPGATPDLVSEAKYILGRARILVGDPEGGIALLNEVANEGFRPTWANAQVALTEYRLGNQEIDTAQALDNLDRLRHVWRGGDFELDLMARLKSLHLERGNYREALTTLRSIVNYFEDSTEADAASEEMDAVFRRLFLDGEADNLEPIAAVSLYNDFFELTPQGDDGQLMLRNLADRLVSVDLLGRAATIIDFQVNNRLRGANKARVAAKLAAIYLLDRQPQKALETLDKSRFRAIPTSLRRERRYLQTRALIDVTRYDDALSLLRQDSSRDAAALRADIHWRTNDWPRAAESFATVLGERYQDPAPLDRQDRNRVLQMTVAYALADDQASIDRTRARWGELMAATEDTTAFEVLTSNPDRASIGFRQVASRIAQLNTLDSFLERYRSDLREEGVGAIN